MLIGAHVSAAGGVQNAPKNAHQAGCEVFQFFSRPPRGGPAPEISQVAVKKFKADCQKYKLKESYLHAPYYINLASKNKRIYFASISVLREELARASQLGAKYVMAHLGSAKDLGEKSAIRQVVGGIVKALDGYKGRAQFLIEISAGAGKIIGDKFEEIAEIIKKSEAQNPKLKNRLGVCFDTAHAFESGYDLRDKKSLKKTLDEFDKIIGLKKLKLIHANDSKTPLASRIDRHEHIGYGKIGLAGFRALIKDPRLQDINLILETPADGKRINDLKTLKKLRAEK